MCQRVCQFLENPPEWGVSVTNSWPSLSSVTDVWPQRCLWRAVVVLHVAPRLLLVCNYAQYLRWRAALVAPPLRFVFDLLACLSSVVHASSVGSMFMMACTSRRDHANVHDVMLVNWTWWSLLHMASTCLALRMSQHRSDGYLMRRSRVLKETLFALSVAASIGITYFGAAQKGYCAEMGGVEDKAAHMQAAQDLFGISELAFMVCTMGFDLTVLYDVPDNVAHAPWPM
ncbi:post-GPI attachment to proteins factor 2-like isoform X2 [Dermacentor albipictus]|uniref:post-GPI attachment to proteins factor 2-like isoform X2 n=1 Tax=Dermacentor albipictus TaxID=60249 RepID=UPI0031FCCA56